MEPMEGAPRSLPREEGHTPNVGVSRPANEVERIDQRPLKRTFILSDSVNQIAQPIFEKSKNLGRQELSHKERSERGKKLLRTATDGTDDLQEIAKEIAQGTITTTPELTLDFSRISFRPIREDTTRNPDG